MSLRLLQLEKKIWLITYRNRFVITKFPLRYKILVLYVTVISEWSKAGISLIKFSSLNHPSIKSFGCLRMPTIFLHYLEDYGGNLMIKFRQLRGGKVNFNSQIQSSATWRIPWLIQILIQSDPSSSSEFLQVQNLSPHYPFVSMVRPTEILMRASHPLWSKLSISVILPLLACCSIVSSWSSDPDLSLSSMPLWMILLHFSIPSFPKSTIIWQEGWPYCSSLLATGLCRKKNKQLVSCNTMYII